MKSLLGSPIFLSLLLAFSGCIAQESIPAPRTLESEALPTPVPLKAETVAVPSPDGTVVAPRALTPDPELVDSNFTPGKNNVYSSVYIRGRVLAMTFDDGPSSEYTNNLLDELKKRNIKATFFLVGQNVVEHPAIVRRIVEEGHEVANHSWSHPQLSRMSDAAVSNELQKTQDAIVAACGVKPTLLRPPYGAITKAQKVWIPEKLGLKIILWSVDPLDWKRPGESVVRSRIVNGASDGAIILAHDIHGGTVRAMPETFDQLAAKGYKFATVSELLAMEEPKPVVAPKVVAKQDGEEEHTNPATKKRKHSAD